MATSQKIAIVGLGYVGLPLAIEFGKLGPTVGFDIDEDKVASCLKGRDPAREIADEVMAEAVHASFSSNPADIADADIIIVAVPTPVDDAHIPDFGPLIGASRTIGSVMKKGATVIFESTVYPGATEEVCVPQLEAASGLKWRSDFFVGYSPERINPGDREHTLTNVIKVVSGDSPDTLERVAELYCRIVRPGVHRASSIRVAEASKVIENTQRDLNIALMNELAIIFDKVGIDTKEVLTAAGTKWNFLNFAPGLVGGHCIGVDPYYLTHKAERLGYHPQVILAGRRINDGMGKYIAEQTIKQMIAAGRSVKAARVNVLGLTFKENCADLRNSKVIDIINELATYGVETFVHDPDASREQAMAEYGVNLMDWADLPRADAVIVAVAHRGYCEMPVEVIAEKVLPGGCFVDVKSVLDEPAIRALGLGVWRL
ncbi:GDP-mannose dehydrogenase [Devosia limi DSM 17137]|uniref:GDP-mannose dehydrogenase n=1 Tax=Devosia limi DSM 17137 TaxID=1121477 RepID=A0A0F5LAI0_9HYPH|nr:nucleotide sugar dehydrogenase [Devosia limi]KKB79401.1 GDP-mannose dehydrogenase [Devosia limi DSM 17137]SHF31873.1 UDP-N-acetyl-D-galactosamine dehydrogenase [Devosia limi DSM 17137]